jgi:hypothetical protein
MQQRSERMNKRLLSISVALILALITLMPSPALAKPERVVKPAQFAAVAEVMVTNPGTSIPQGSKIITRGEIIEGVFNSVQGWPALNGASLHVRHNSVITLAPLGANGIGKYQGNASALVVVSPVGGGRLTGIYTATIQGEYTFTQDGQLVIQWVLDTGTFKAAGRILGEDGRTFVTAQGEWAATLLLTQVPTPPGYTLAGQAHLDGQYREIDFGR